MLHVLQEKKGYLHMHYISGKQTIYDIITMSNRFLLDNIIFINKTARTISHDNKQYGHLNTVLIV